MLLYLHQCCINTKIMNFRKPIFYLILLLFSTTFMIGCDDDAPEIENEEEVIAGVTLTFTPVSGGTPLSFTYTDPDGNGAQQPAITPIVLNANTPYRLDISLTGLNGEDITAEVREEADEHMFFFGWSDPVFETPAGTGNIPSRTGTVNYTDSDSKNQPLGLTTLWATGDPATGKFTTILKHQPNIKSGTSTVNDGETDLEIEWDITVE